MEQKERKRRNLKSRTKKKGQLEIFCQNLEPDVFESLMKDKKCQQLKMIRIWGCTISKRQLLQMKLYHWANLSQLILNQLHISPHTIKGLTKIQFSALTKLSFSRNSLGVEGLRYLTKSSWKELRQINLCCNKMQMDGYIYLQQNNWKSIQIVGFEQKQENLVGVLAVMSYNWLFKFRFDIYFGHEGFDNSDFKDNIENIVQSRCKKVTKNLQDKCNIF